MNTMKKIILISLWPMILLGGACEKPQKNIPHHPTVTYTIVSGQEIDLKRDLPGRVVARRMAEIRPQTGGILKERLFEEGDNVKEDQILYRIDDAPLKAAYEEAKARHARASAKEEAARRHMERCILLTKNNAVRLQERDDAIAAYKEVRAEIAESREQMERAAINLGYSDIRAPISGRIGSSFVREGALLSPAQSEPLAVIRQFDPIYIDVSLPAVEMMSLRQAKAQGTLGEADHKDMEIFLENDTPYSSLAGHKLNGEILFSETMADELTGTVSLRARIANPDALLLPGMYVKARISQGKLSNAIAIPQRCAARDNKNRPVVYVLIPDKENLFRLEERLISIQGEHEGKWIVADGIKEGEFLLVEGLQKASDGLLVNGRSSTLTEK